MPSAASLSILGVMFPRTEPYAPTSPQPRLSGKISTMFGRAAWADSRAGVNDIAPTMNTTTHAARARITMIAAMVEHEPDARKEGLSYERIRAMNYYPLMRAARALLVTSTTLAAM